MMGILQKNHIYLKANVKGKKPFARHVYMISLVL